MVRVCSERCFLVRPIAPRGIQRYIRLETVTNYTAKASPTGIDYYLKRNRCGLGGCMRYLYKWYRWRAPPPIWLRCGVALEGIGSPAV